MVDITLVTCTGDRQVAFDACQLMMERQTCQDWKWIVVDDGKEPTRCRLGQKVIRLSPESDRNESFRKNYIAALEAVDTYKLLFIEDDDWYSNTHVELIGNSLGIGGTRGCGKDEVYIAGQARAKYYNVLHRCWHVFNNLSHSSLCQTGMCNKEMFNLCVRLLRRERLAYTLDSLIWRYYETSIKYIRAEHKLLIPASTTCVGIKGMPGRRGIGVGHASRGYLESHGYAYDPDMVKLKEWVGNDWYWYANCYSEQPQSEEWIRPTPRKA